MLDHVHMLFSIHQNIRWHKQLAISRAKVHNTSRTDFFPIQRNFTGQQFWARGYYVSTVGRDEKTIRDYLKAQEAEDLKLDRPDLFG